VSDQVRTCDGSSTRAELTSVTSPLTGELTSLAACATTAEASDSLCAQRLSVPPVHASHTALPAMQFAHVLHVLRRGKRLMRLRTFTDSTTPNCSACFTSEPTSGSSTYTMSPSSACCSTSDSR